MGKLQVLPARLANMIAAGEVVQRPSSVVKELMENAIDAGATKVDVFLSDSGRTLIQVIDNGCGMSPEDAVLCFERHATSKIATADELEGGILTFGFRGEALASIAAVSEVTLKTRREKDETATVVTVSESEKLKVGRTEAPVGSNFAIRNLFYNTPARRKFLKSDTVELKHCVEEFSRVALTRPEIEFSLVSNGRPLLSLKKAKSLKFRVQDVLGAGVVGDLVDISAETSVLGISGFLGRPESSRRTLGNQYFFINGRFFRSSYLHKAVMKAYEGLIPEGVTPSYFLFLEADPSTVDVNIHPTKTEIKFEEENVIFQIIYAAVKETVGKYSFGAAIDFEAGASIQMPTISGTFSEYRGDSPAPSAEFDPEYDPFKDTSTLDPFRPESFDEPRAYSGETSFQKPSGALSRTENYGVLFDQNIVQASSLVVRDKYIVTRSASGMMVVNIRRARERVLYEKYLDALSGENHVTQTALFPVQVQVGAASVLLLEEYAPTLSSLGFEIAPFGTDTVVVSGVPEGFSCETGKVEEAVRYILGILSEEKSSLPEVFRANMAERFAAASALGANPAVTPSEAQNLIDALFACGNPDRTPSGLKTISIITLEELDKRF